MSSKPATEGEDPHDVVFESKYGLRNIILNRPKKLNSLNASMIAKIFPRMIEWEKSDMANVVVLKGAGEKALCAGGDVTALAEMNKKPNGWKKSAQYFGDEYKLDHYIATYRKPYIAFMDGITMGGGVGLSIHAPFRIATEKTVFAMPETTIGFFPDVGASFFLPRMNGSVGTYLALTSERLTGPNVFYAGVATHYIHSTSLPELENRLAEIRFKDEDDQKRRLELINATLEEFATGLPFDQPMQIKGPIRNAIDRCFSKDTVPEIYEALEAEKANEAQYEDVREWAGKQIATLKKRSPTAVHVTLKQMRSSREWNIAETFKKEHQIATEFMKHPDFTEGVTALLVEKRAPKWEPVPDDGAGVAEPFFNYSEAAELDLHDNKRKYYEYPHAWIGVPSEAEIEDLISQKDWTKKELRQHLIATRNGRQGVAEVVNEILKRKTKEVGKTVRWRSDQEPAEQAEEPEKANL